MELFKSLLLTCLCLAVTTGAPSRHHKNRNNNNNNNSNNNNNNNQNGNARAPFGSLSRHHNTRHNRVKAAGATSASDNDVLSRSALRKIRLLKKKERKGKFSFQDCGKFIFINRSKAIPENGWILQCTI